MVPSSNPTKETIASSRSNLSAVLPSMPPPESTPQLSKRKSRSLFMYGPLEDDGYANSGQSFLFPASLVAIDRKFVT
ncbi:hypothetical protein SLE2022_193830 [Rubroshorea leprosula]